MDCVYLNLKMLPQLYSFCWQGMQPGDIGWLAQAKGLLSDLSWTPGQPAQRSWFTHGETESGAGAGAVTTATWVLESHFVCT